MNNIFYEGQEVGCLIYGEGVVEEINAYEHYSIRVEFKHCNAGYTESGQFNFNARPTLYPLEQYRAIIANLPAPQPEAWQPKPGEWCWFWDRDYVKPSLDKFEAMDGEFFQAELHKWEYCAPFIGELPPHLKEVQP
jgi:hypothetical protein